MKTRGKQAVAWCLCAGLFFSAVGAANPARAGRRVVKHSGQVLVLKKNVKARLSFRGLKKKASWRVTNPKLVQIKGKKKGKSVLIWTKKQGKTRLIAKAGKKKYTVVLRIKGGGTSESASSAPDATSSPTQSGWSASGTAKPTASITPQGTMPAVWTKQPMNTPGYTLAPRETSQPAGTLKPSTSMVSQETSSPAGTLKPSDSTAPQETSSPAGTLKPSDSTAPQETSSPAGTLKPSDPTAPQETSSPAGTTEPTVLTAPQQEYDASTVDEADYVKYFSPYAVHKSTATFYDNGYTNTCCNLDDIASGYDVCAINEYDYHTGLMAGAYLEVTGPKGTVNVLVTDLMPYQGNEANCTVGALDLNEHTFAKIANPVDGKVPISWKVIAFPANGPLQYKFKPESNQWWTQIQVRNTTYPVKKLELKKADGTYQELPRENYNYFTAEKGLGGSTASFRVTDIFGRVLEDTVAFGAGQIVNGSTNFEKVR